jgi:tetratricopeptide (TPR) repeat protein
MIPSTTPKTSNDRKLLPRRTLLQILQVALEIPSSRFARQAALNWLAIYPGDLSVNLMLAQTWLVEGKPAQALSILSKLCQLDPEYLEAHVVLARALAGSGTGKENAAWGLVYALGGKTPNGLSLPGWSGNLRKANELMKAKQYDRAEPYVLKTLAATQDLNLAALMHLKLAYYREDYVTAVRLASNYASRWNNCLPLLLLLADSQIRSGDETKAVQLVHQCVANDSAGQVPLRLWGTDHQYRPLWPDNLEIPFDLPVPSEVASRFGWNQLPAGAMPAAQPAPEMAKTLPSAPAQQSGSNVIKDKEVSIHELFDLIEAYSSQTKPNVSAPTVQAALENKRVAQLKAQEQAVQDEQLSALEDTDPNAPTQPIKIEGVSGKEMGDGAPVASSEAVQGVQETFERLAKKMNATNAVRTDGRFPMYVVLATRAGLQRQYGPQSAAVIDGEMKRLVEVIRRRPGWGALMFYPDDPECVKALGIETVDVIDPWKIKLALGDLDKILSRKGEMIASLLIVGGPDVVPFHRLPNPTDDMDPDVLSDNPYSTSDSNYFVPEWPVGRLPGEAGSDACCLLGQLRQTIQYHTQKEVRKTWKLKPVPTSWFTWLRGLFQRRAKVSKGFGYTAAAWQRSSQVVFSPVTETQRIMASPPEYSGSFEPELLIGSPVGYYNLHGMKETSEWYGQRDVTDPLPGPDYPVALSPRDLVKNGHAPQIVFSEACYGGYVVGKKEDQAMSLKFISLGALGMVGSTCIAYGSVSAPLIGADLLGYNFWRNLRSGMTTGEALMQAKIELAREMSKRQGYLDGEDQKTLISFVLYGDPLVHCDAIQPRASKALLRLKERQVMKTVVDGQELDAQQALSSPTQVMKEIKMILEPYLPGLDDVEVHMLEQRMRVNGKDAKNVSEENIVVTVSKEVHMSHHIHRHYARVTLNKQGKMVKLAISR